LAKQDVHITQQTATRQRENWVQIFQTH